MVTLNLDPNRERIPIVTVPTDQQRSWREMETEIQASSEDLAYFIVSRIGEGWHIASIGIRAFVLSHESGMSFAVYLENARKKYQRTITVRALFPPALFRRVENYRKLTTHISEDHEPETIVSRIKFSFLPKYQAEWNLATA